MKYLLIILILGISITTFSQENQELNKKESKKQEQKEAKKEMERLYKIVESKKFVVEADLVYGTSGDTFPVQSNINFFI